GLGLLASFSVSEALAWSGGSPCAEARRSGPSRSRRRGWAQELLQPCEQLKVPCLAPREGSDCPRDIQKARNLRNKAAASDRGPGGRCQRCAPGRAASARPLRTQAQADPHGLLAFAAAAAGARLRKEPLRSGRRAEAAGRQPQPLRDAGEGVVPESEDKVQTAEAGGGRA
uniref:Empty spiracles homeobox 1 n=1 Tax=Cebus imitator TaxID=2715852 RepID=A0A2K5S242_CEBIM